MGDMFEFNEEGMILEKRKRRRHYENGNNEVNEDRLSYLPDGVLLHILSFLNTEHVVRTCVLSTRWKQLWKNVHTLILKFSCCRFFTYKHFALFVSKVLALRDNSIALHSLDFDHIGKMEPWLLQKILSYVCSHDTQLRQLKITVSNDSGLIMQCDFSCQALTSLQLSVYPRVSYCSKTIFPKSLNLPALTSLDLSNFTFCGGENDCVEPFSVFTKLNSLVIRGCKVRDAHILNISSETLVNFAMYYNSSKFDKIELSTPSLSTFTFHGTPSQKICGSNLSSIKQVKIYAKMYSNWEKPPMILFSWLQDLASVKSLKVSSITLQILSLVPDLLEVKPPSFCNLKSTKIELEPLHFRLSCLLKDTMLKKADEKSPKEADKLRKAFEAGLEPPSIPDGIVDFLLRNTPLTKVDITTSQSDLILT